jgi:hypothetical protein
VKVSPIAGAFAPDHPALLIVNVYGTVFVSPTMLPVSPFAVPDVIFASYPANSPPELVGTVQAGDGVALSVTVRRLGVMLEMVPEVNGNSTILLFPESVTHRFPDASKARRLGPLRLATEVVGGLTV